MDQYDPEQLKQDKSIQLNTRIAKRDQSTESILKTFDIDFDVSYENITLEVNHGPVTVTDRPDQCYSCHGKGRIQGLFGTSECAICHGTGLDLSNPLAVIQWQKACLQWAKNTINTQRETMKLCGVTKGQIEDAKRNEMYAKTNRFID
ncbi:hypothetical protein A1QO_04150 [Vibrio genomosp. F10 str. ZF-129]|uniref:Uncharacterized protein n=1 Tax=Vibrio genomosp. F10 str. ZF-129 TaxID=1187848 RepID=A0A1E5BIP1_9VIBR|nr:hypothetical protein [Vibrio genomosp. F10]OEE37304.1 hypothetical protein A1QO_04150 [Vibrio genomosp. F10 str. ZF-129]